MNKATTEPAYNYKVVRQFAIMTVVWGVIGMGLGVLIASQLVWPQMNFDLPWTSFGRLRPLHTNLVIFAFGGCALFATSYYTVQRTCQVRLFSDTLAAFTFWGWQAVAVILLVSLPLGNTTTKEYAEIEFTGAIWLAIVWVAYAVVFFGTLIKRKVKHIYVGNWFFGSFILTTAMLHIVNHMSLPVSWFKSYSMYSGATDAMVQWWYGHNAVGFFLTTGFLGMMYYFVPKQAGRPVYSYRLSIVHFWALITHAGALGWVAMITIGSLYHLIPKVYGVEKMHSVGLINAHFWLATIGTVLYIASLWVNGITQGLMWRAVNEDGTLTYSFVESLVASHPGFIVRLVGGGFFLTGMLLMSYNTWRTVRQARPEGILAAARMA
ncbi:cbb3-type cytochrome c oxidase subunit I [Pseudomonas aeruginosa]|uniref:cbb3-type cytochrome c oxidase subunit I n=1 Tax=Pseudomonas aeruginosa TaxID=287 RepID=UPI003557B055